MQHDLISKKLKPYFEVSHDKLIDFEKLKPKSKPLKSVLKVPPKVIINRKDLAVNWDEAF
jgi:hypothetical protein